MAIVFGNINVGREIAKKFADGSAPYRELAAGRLDGDWESLPVLTKKSFYSKHSWRDLLPREQYRDVYAVLRSSGTSAGGSSKGFFWPQLKSKDAPQLEMTRALLEKTFRLKDLPTLAITGMSLGSWAGGEQFSFLFKSIGLNAPYPFVTFSPGNAHEEIIEILEQSSDAFAQILIVLCPSAIFYLNQVAEKRGFKMPHEKTVYLVTGEPFPESMRRELNTRAGRLAIASVYGSADTGMIGVESEALIRVRAVLDQKPELAQNLGLSDGPVPNFFHLMRQDALYEVVNDELYVTQWQGIPLVRYNLEDRAKCLPWDLIRDTLRGTLDLPSGLPPVLAIGGRSEGCLFLCGSNVFDGMIETAVRKSAIWDFIQPNYLVWTDMIQGRQVMRFQFEWRDGVKPASAETWKQTYAQLVDELGAQQPEFAEDYQKFYLPHESSGQRVFEFFVSPNGALSRHPSFQGRIKWKRIMPGGPYEPNDAIRF